MQVRPKCTQTLWNTPKTWVYGPMGRIRCVGYEKLQHDFVARTFALIGPVQYVLQQVSCGYGTIPNARKYYKMDRNISLGSNGVDWVHSLRKISTWLCGTTFALIAPVHPVLHQVSCSYKTIPNVPKYYKTYWNITLGSNGVDSVRPLRKIPMWLRGTNFCINWTSSVCFAKSFMQLWNDSKCTQILQNGPKH